MSAAWLNRRANKNTGFKGSEAGKFDTPIAITRIAPRDPGEILRRDVTSSECAG